MWPITRSAAACPSWTSISRCTASSGETCPSVRRPTARVPPARRGAAGGVDALAPLLAATTVRRRRRRRCCPLLGPSSSTETCTGLTCAAPTRRWTWTPASVCVSAGARAETAGPTGTWTPSAASVCAARRRPARRAMSSTRTPASAPAPRRVPGTSRSTGPSAPASATSRPTSVSSEGVASTRPPAAACDLPATPGGGAVSRALSSARRYAAACRLTGGD